MGDKRKNIELTYGRKIPGKPDDSIINGTTMKPDDVKKLNEHRNSREVKIMKVKREVPDIENGTVIDHIPAGYGIEIYQLLENIAPEKILLLGKTDSKKMGTKDLIKMYGHKISEEDVKTIYSLFEGVDKPTISYIENWEVYEKLKPI